MADEVKPTEAVRPPDDYDRRLNASAALAVSADDESLKKVSGMT